MQKLRACYCSQAVRSSRREPCYPDQAFPWYPLPCISPWCGTRTFTFLLYMGAVCATPVGNQGEGSSCFVYVVLIVFQAARLQVWKTAVFCHPLLHTFEG